MLTVLLYVPVVLSTLVLAAHFLRSGRLFMVLASLSLLIFLAIPRRWSSWVVRVGLWVGALVWIRTLAGFVAMRARHGAPYARLAVILGSVALFTALSSLVFLTGRMRGIYAAGPEGEGSGPAPR